MIEVPPVRVPIVGVRVGGPVLALACALKLPLAVAPLLLLPEAVLQAVAQDVGVPPLLLVADAEGLPVSVAAAREGETVESPPGEPLRTLQAVALGVAPLLRCALPLRVGAGLPVMPLLPLLPLLAVLAPVLWLLRDAVEVGEEREDGEGVGEEERLGA